MRSLRDVNRGGRALALALLGVILGSALFAVLAWPATRRQSQCEALAERVAYTTKRLTRGLSDPDAVWAEAIRRAGGDAEESILATSKEFLRLDLSPALATRAEAMVAAFLALGHAAGALDGSPATRQQFAAAVGEARGAVASLRKVCVP